MNQATTELDAVNAMLATIGEAPVSTLENPMHADAAMARQTLAQAGKEIQAEGWYFNVETDYPLHPDTDGKIKLPENIVNVDVEPRHATKNIDVVQRGQRLYNRAGHTYTFDAPLAASVVLLLPWDELWILPE